MSLMLKLLSTTLVSSALLMGATNSEVESFLQKGIGKNPNISDLKVKVLTKKPVKGLKGWESFIVALDGKFKQGSKVKDINQNVIYFASGNYITPELLDIKTGKKLNDSITPEMTSKFYKKENLLYGNVNATHKVAIFSDPLCPFCRKLVPPALEYMKKYPKTFAVYYYHFPIATLHPASVTITKAALVAQEAGIKDAILKMYKIKVDARSTNDQVILDAFNKAVGSNVSAMQAHSTKVEDQFAVDQKIARELMVNGTPTMFFDGKKDTTKKKYKQVKAK